MAPGPTPRPWVALQHYVRPYACLYPSVCVPTCVCSVDGLQARSAPRGHVVPQLRRGGGVVFVCVCVCICADGRIYPDRPVRPYVVYPMHPSMAMLRAAVGRKTGVALAGRGLAHWHCAVLAPAWPHSAPGDAPSNSLQARIPAYLPSAHLAPLSAPSPPRAWLGLSAIAAHAHPGTLAFAHSPWPLAM